MKQDLKTISFFIPAPDEPGSGRREMASLALGVKANRIQAINAGHAKDTPYAQHELELLQEFANESYGYLALFVHAKHNEDGSVVSPLDQVLDASEEDLNAMRAALGVAGSKVPPESSGNDGNSTTP